MFVRIGERLGDMEPTITQSGALYFVQHKETVSSRPWWHGLVRGYHGVADEGVAWGEMSIDTNQHSITRQPLTPVPPDDLQRIMKVAKPDTDRDLPHIGLVGNTYTILLSSNDTNGRYCLIDMHVLPGGGPPPHRHDFEESFTVLAGEIEAMFRGEMVAVKAGETLSIPANAPHSFTNRSEEPARLLCICAPAGQEEFFDGVGVRVPTRTTAPPELDGKGQAALRKKAEELAPKYRTELEPIPRSQGDKT